MKSSCDAISLSNLRSHLEHLHCSRHTQVFNMLFGLSVFTRLFGRQPIVRSAVSIPKRHDIRSLSKVFELMLAIAYVVCHGKQANSLKRLGWPYV